MFLFESGEQSGDDTEYSSRDHGDSTHSDMETPIPPLQRLSSLSPMTRIESDGYTPVEASTT